MILSVEYLAISWLTLLINYALNPTINIHQVLTKMPHLEKPKLDINNREDMMKLTSIFVHPIANSNLDISVKDFGAVGNGIVDDTKAIQSAIDAVSESGGGVVFFPSGIYKVSINPGKSKAITIRANIILKGFSNKESIIKLADNQGDFDAILGGERLDSNILNFAMYNLAIDGNGTNNPVNNESDLLKKGMRYSLRIYLGSKINIEGCRFINQNNTNSITVNNDEGFLSDVKIKNNIFELIGGGQIDYDHSTIYTHGKRIEISDNYFSSRHGAGTYGARTAIEIHGDEHIVRNNIIHGFTNGINVTGVASSSHNQLITNNFIKDAHSGIVIWSKSYKNKSDKYALNNCIISHNKITINVDGWRKLWGNDPSAGITLEPDSDAPFKNLEIINNQIYFTKPLKNGRNSDSLANGIRMWRSDFPQVESENIRIIGNKIENSLAGGIYIYMTIKKGEISENTILNPGKSNGTFHDDYRAGILVSGDLNQVNINNNFLIDNQVKNTLKLGIISFANCINRCQAKGNSLQISSGAKLKIFEFKSHKNNFEI
jgi:hypothetical protein